MGKNFTRILQFELDIFYYAISDFINTIAPIIGITSAVCKKAYVENKVINSVTSQILEIYHKVR